MLCYEAGCYWVYTRRALVEGVHIIRDYVMRGILREYLVRGCRSGGYRLSGYMLKECMLWGCRLQGCILIGCVRQVTHLLQPPLAVVPLAMFSSLATVFPRTLSVPRSSSSYLGGDGESLGGDN